MPKYPKISELTNVQRVHLIWRLDHKTYCGLLTAAHIAKGDHEEDYELNKVFEMFDMKPHQAKIHATKVINFKMPAHV
jgi:hypothetical protein